MLLEKAYRSTLFLAFLGAFAAAPAPAQTLGGAPYVNSWVGNTYGTPPTHIAHTIDHLFVTSSGNVATITSWDEGGANTVLYSPTGAQICVPEESGTGSWGRMSGKAVFADETYLYQSMSQKGGFKSDDLIDPADLTMAWKCIRRYNLDGTGAPFPGGKGYDQSMLVVNTDASELTPTGVIIYNHELFVSDPIAGQIKVFNAATMATVPLRSFAMANPGQLDFDRQGMIWMLDVVQKKLIRFSRTGDLQPQIISLPSPVAPTAFCVDRVNDRILVANNGPDQNILIYSGIMGEPVQTSTLGIPGGINSGIAGAIEPLKFSEPKGVGIDSAGNIFVGNNGLAGGGARLEKYDKAGAMQWRLSGALFTAGGDVSPADETEFYSSEYRFKLNLDHSAPGSEWSFAAQTLNKVKYPGDERIPVKAKGEKNWFWTTAYPRMVSGKKLLFISDMVGSGLGIYRFKASTDGETAIPSGLFAGGDRETIWRDANGNGSQQPDEIQTKPADNPYSQHIFPDANGGVWKANREQGIRYFPLQGFDAYENPIYSYDGSRVIAAPEIADVRRVVYDAAGDVLYVTGASASGVLGGDWGVAGDRLVRYNQCLGARTTAWSIALPFRATEPNPRNVKGYCEAGDYLFLMAYREGRLYVHRKSDGGKVGEILPTTATGKTSGWADIVGPVSATRRSNGEYLIFAEENGNGKIMLYRWNPNILTPPAAPKRKSPPTRK